MVGLGHTGHWLEALLSGAPRSRGHSGGPDQRVWEEAASSLPLVGQGEPLPSCSPWFPQGWRLRAPVSFPTHREPELPTSVLWSSPVLPVPVAQVSPPQTSALLSNFSWCPLASAAPLRC